MAFENVYGKAYGVNQRGRYDTFAKAVDAIYKELSTQHDSFFDSLPDLWSDIFPEIKARPGRFEDGVIVLYVRSSAMLFALRPKLKAIAKKLGELPGAPKKINLRLEIHA